MTLRLQKDADGKLRQRIQIRDNVIFADEGGALGGDDRGFSPHDLFDASLAACKAMTVLLYAQRKAMPLDSVDIEIDRDSSQESKGQYGLNVKLHFNGALSEDDKTRLTEIAGRCPIHKLMTTAEIAVTTETV
jgi:putative redox protein